MKSIKQTFEKFPHIGPLLPAMGYSNEQVQDLKDTIEAADCDSIVIGTPIDLGKLIDLGKPSTRVRYSLAEVGEPNLETVLADFLAKIKVKKEEPEPAQE